MEHDDLEKKFRDIIRNDQSELNEEEIESKELIWGKLELPQKEKRIFPFWKIAASILFLISIGSLLFFMNQNNLQDRQFAQLNEELIEAQNLLKSVEFELTQLKSKQNTDLKTEEITIEKESPKIVELVKKEIIEKLIYQRDTVFIETNPVNTEIIKLVRDTVFIEVPIKETPKFVDIETDEKNQNDQLEKEKKKSQKMEFVFGKKTISKPGKQSSIIFNDTELAKKTVKSTRSNVLIFPLNNN